MGKKSLDPKTADLEKENERKSAFSVAPPLPKREFPPSVCNCQPCQQTAVSGYTAISQPVPPEPRFMPLQSMAGAVSVPPSVYLPKSKLNLFLLLKRFLLIIFRPFSLHTKLLN